MAKELEDYLEKTDELKRECSKAMGVEVEWKIVKLASEDLNIKQNSFKKLQEMWESLNPETTPNYDVVEASFWKLSQKRASKNWPAKWDLSVEATYMKKMRLQYRKTGTDADKMKGCIARMVGLAIRKMRRRLWYFSQKKHGHGRIISAHKK